MTLKPEIWTRISETLEDWDLEDFVEYFDVSKEETVLTLFEAGMIDPVALSTLLDMDIE